MDQVSVTFKDLETNAPLSTEKTSAEKVTVEQVRNIATSGIGEPQFYHPVHTGVLHVENASFTRIGDKRSFSLSSWTISPTVYTTLYVKLESTVCALGWARWRSQLNRGGSSQVVGPVNECAKRGLEAAPLSIRLSKIMLLDVAVWKIST